ncbi:DUF2274 domain-containing protein [Kiloniella laminariae]|uniref:DUF2274 domain-containing protein n=1 Tax=Kiloniella laminariae TaxID=454162 RepID=A0ABT4LPL2_9PROT|nr:DUF2274 domain-containing protein [Kiloniella laminariae]MCZ4283073.1 DUF2274 domain-containing protein [Kiloniella laminariae]
MSVGIGPVVKDEDVTIKKLIIPSSLNDDLQLYARAYEEQYNQTINQEMLIVELLKNSLIKDTKFQKFKKSME